MAGLKLRIMWTIISDFHADHYLPGYTCFPYTERNVLPFTSLVEETEGGNSSDVSYPKMDLGLTADTGLFEFQTDAIALRIWHVTPLHLALVDQ